MDSESTPQPAKPVRRDEQPNFEKNILEPSHKMPPFITRHEPNVPELIRRGHLHPNEMDHKLDPRTNQPTHPDKQSIS
jgi:hypothetical protein